MFKNELKREYIIERRYDKAKRINMYRLVLAITYTHWWFGWKTTVEYRRGKFFNRATMEQMARYLSITMPHRDGRGF